MNHHRRTFPISKFCRMSM